MLFGSRIMHGAVVTAEDGPVVIGADVVVLENAVIRGRGGHPTMIGDGVMVGPHAHLNGCVVGAGSFPSTFRHAQPDARIEPRPNARIE